jgi:hypothetical protein
MRVLIWTGYAGPEWVWPKAHPTADSDPELLPQQRGGGDTSEQVSQVITYNLAVSAPHRLSSKIPLPGACGSSPPSAPM